MLSPELDLRPKDGESVRSVCEMCLNNCGIIVYRQNGMVTKIEGDADNPRNAGRLCGKGLSGFISTRAPNRVTQPLKRTNPKKGPGEDPGWEAISWEEALNTVAAKLRDIKKKDPRLLYVTTFGFWISFDIVRPWSSAFGSTLTPFSSGFYCGNNVHNIQFATTGALEANPDGPMTKYLLLFGSQYGAVVNYDVMHAAHAIASKRPGGIKVVAIDPIGTYSAGKAEEWLPIRPGTDAALALCFINLLVNEYGIYDKKFLQIRTNAPYLIGADELYVRDPNSNKILVWDASEGKAKPWDESVTDYALEGTYTVNGAVCQPAFQKLKDHVKKYDPESVSKITTIAPDTIRRIAREFGEAANIGGTITVNGVEMPYRPASVAYYRGLSAHQHSMLSGLAVITLQVLIGGIDVPGGLLASDPGEIKSSSDGLLSMIPWADAPVQQIWSYYPPRDVAPPKSAELLELFPLAPYSRPFFLKAVLKPEEYNPPLVPEMLIAIRTNLAKSSVSPEEIGDFLDRIPFMVKFSLELDETSEFADIIFPDLHYLECLSMGRSDQLNEGQSPTSFYGQKPVVKPPFEPPWDRLVNPGEIFLELAERAGFMPDVYTAINNAWGLKEPYKLDPKQRYTYSEMVDRRLKSKLGPQFDLNWFLKDGLLVREKTAEKMYRGPFTKARIHVYFEFMKKTGEDVERVTKQLGIGWDTSDYQNLPDWKPCQAQKKKTEKFDLILINYKVPQLSYSFSHANKMLSRLGERSRVDDLMINAETAKQKGIEDGDSVWLETVYGKKVKARARVTELIHPEVVGCQGGGGRYAKKIGSGRGMGINFNELVSLENDNLDYVTTALDSHIPVSVYKA